MLLETAGDAFGFGHVGSWRPKLFRILNAQLEVANGVHVLVELPPVGGAEAAFEPA